MLDKIKENDSVTLINKEFKYKFSGTARINKKGDVFIENATKNGGYSLTLDLIDKNWDEVIVNGQNLF